MNLKKSLLITKRMLQESLFIGRIMGWHFRIRICRSAPNEINGLIVGEPGGLRDGGYQRIFKPIHSLWISGMKPLTM